MARVVGIEQDYDLTTRYCQAFRQRFVCSHPIFNSSHNHTLAPCFNAQAVPAAVHAAVQQADVRFITGSGHGVYEAFTGQGGVVLWDADSTPSTHVTGKIIHLLSCQTGGILGLAFIALGADAFWGYTVDFTFFHLDPPPNQLATDAVAAPFFHLDAIIDRGILTGQNATTIYADIDAYFWRTYYQLSSLDQAQAQAFLDNFVHLVCPAKTWGNPLATF